MASSSALRKDYSEMQRSVHEQRNRGAWFAKVWLFMSTRVSSSFGEDIKQNLLLLCSHIIFVPRQLELNILKIFPRLLHGFHALSSAFYTWSGAELDLGIPTSPLMISHYYDCLENVVKNPLLCKIIRMQCHV